jgi:sugar lactone lactonase YvrE
VVSTFLGGGLSGEGGGSFVDGDGWELEGEEYYPTVARFNRPYGMVIGKDAFYVTDTRNHSIREVVSGIVEETLFISVRTLAGGAPVGETEGGYVDGEGTAARFNRPHGIVADKEGNLYIADTFNHRIRKVTPQGEVSTLAGSGVVGKTQLDGAIDGPGNTAKFNNPIGLTIDQDGKLYLTDYWNHRIRKVTPQGEVSTLAGSGPIGEELDGVTFADGPGPKARFSLPLGITIDAMGDLYVTDSNNHLIRKISLEKMEN